MRTQISLTEDERRVLDAASARTGRSISALIRDAVDAVYGDQRRTEDDLAAMGRAFGSWAHRGTDGAAYMELRSGRRLQDSAGQDRAGQDSAGQDIAGQDIPWACWSTRPS